MTDTGRPGVSTKWKTLSFGSASEPARTMPLTLASASVNCVKATDADAFGAMVTGLLSMVWPSMSSVTGRLTTGTLLRFVTPAVTMMRSWPENDARAKATDGTATLETSSDATDTGVSTVPSGKCTSSTPAHPD